MDDEYVAQILAKEARDSSQRYSSGGLYVAPKPTSNAPKPNTRFLRHLIKETDNHNTALKRKEERESRERIRALKQQSAAASDSTSHSSRRANRTSTRDSERSRQNHDDRHRSHRRRHRSRSTSTDRDRSRRHRHRDERDRNRTRDDRHDRSERREHRRHESSRTSRRDRSRSYSQSRSRSPRRERNRSRDRDRDRTSRSHRSERSGRSESPSHTRSSHSNRTSRESERRSRRDENTSSRKHHLSPPKSQEPRGYKSSSTPTQHPDNSDESDPLEDIVGPLPPSNTTSDAPIRSRGRGAYRYNSSNIDAHFAPDYDPTLDVHPDEDEDNKTTQSSRRHVPGLMTGEDDWDMALEALRDRTKWKQKGEERLRAAGINENAIDRWKNEPAFNGLDGERRPEDVKWSKSGEGREWDRGKFVDNEGHIDVRAAWSL